MSTEDWKLQVSYKTPGGDMINIRANTADELSVLLEGIGDYSPQIAAVRGLVVASYNTAPLETPPLMPSTPPSTSSAPAPTSNPGLSATPTCPHGARIHKSGISSKTGKPYAMWVCSLPQSPEQCKPVN